jgi:hypothetical protein
MILYRSVSRAAAPAAIMAALFMACGDDGSTPAPGDGPDTHAPEAIDDLGLAYDAPDDAVLFTWTAPHDDGGDVGADHYDIRYGSSFPFDWERSTRVADPPLPLAPGSAQELTLASPARGQEIYASIRTFDAAGNQSAAGTVAHVRVPGFSFDATCVDALTASPIAGLDASITTRTTDHLVTGTDGRLYLPDVGGGTVGVLLSRGSAATAYHTFSAVFPLSSDISQVFPIIPFQDPESDLYASILALLRDGLFSPGGERVIRRWHSYPVSFYARDFVNVNGLDYRALLQQAADRWNTRLGFQMFVPTVADPPTGILVEFLPRSTMGSVNGVTEYSPDADGYPVHDRIRIVDDMTDGPRLYSIFMHELGHTIPLVHLPVGFIMYGSQPLPDDITDDEVTMVQLLLALPNGTILDRYDPSPPTP